MSFDVFVQAFSDGDAAEADADAIRAVLAPYIHASEKSGFVRLVTPDGGADLYGYEDLSSGFMMNHMSGDDVWEALVDAATASRLAILPVGCSTCVTSEATLASLPENLAADARLVETGAELRSVIGDVR